MKIGDEDGNTLYLIRHGDTEGTLGPVYGNLAEQGVKAD